MLSFFRRDNNIYAPIEGYCLDITECKDPIFAQKIMGDGFMIEPKGQIVKSPCDGKVVMIFPTKHAIGIKMDSGQEVMIHIGINTVKLNGEGFKSLVSQNTTVKKGTALLQLDVNYINSMGYDATNIIILTNVINTQYRKEKLNCDVMATDKIIGFGSE